LEVARIICGVINR